jgi:hypothetical protein
MRRLQCSEAARALSVCARGRRAQDTRAASRKKSQRTPNGVGEERGRERGRERPDVRCSLLRLLRVCLPRLPPLRGHVHSPRPGHRHQAQPWSRHVSSYAERHDLLRGRSCKFLRVTSRKLRRGTSGQAPTRQRAARDFLPLPPTIPTHTRLCGGGERAARALQHGACDGQEQILKHDVQTRG